MSNGLIDMHMHTNYSDGDLSPNELIEKAIASNVDTMAITDHNIIEGLKHIDEKYRKEIEIINGIELSAKVPRGSFHILGYDIDINNQFLNSKMYELKNESLQRTLSLIEQLKKDYGIYFDYQDIKDLINSNRNLGRPDLAKLLIKQQMASSVYDAFQRYLIAANRKIKGLNKEKDYLECLEIITTAGGIPVLAHPKTLKLKEDDLETLIKNMKSNGLMGIEVYHPIHSDEERSLYLELAKKYNLLISGGSDYHGEITKPDIEIATGKNNNIKIKKLSLLDEIRNRR